MLRFKLERMEAITSEHSRIDTAAPVRMLREVKELQPSSSMRSTCR